MEGAFFGRMARPLCIEYPGAIYCGFMNQTGFTTAANHEVSILSSDPLPTPPFAPAAT